MAAGSGVSERLFEPGSIGGLEIRNRFVRAGTSCNLCLTHEGHHSLRCWRKPRRRLLRHAIYRFSGGFRRERIAPREHA